MTKQLGTGIAYRFNNFKNKKVLHVAEEADRIDRMLWQVKKLIRKRDKLYTIQGTGGADKSNNSSRQ